MKSCYLRMISFYIYQIQLHLYAQCSSLLKQFGLIFGYKVSMHKSQLFPINSEAFDLDYSNIQFQIERKQFT